MMVGYTHHSKTLWRIWLSDLQKVTAQSEVVFDKERNAHMSCPHGSNEIDMVGLPEDEEYVDEKIPEMSLSEIVNLRRQVRDPHLTCMKLLMRNQKASRTASASAGRIRLPSVWQQMQNTSPTAGASAEWITLPGARQQQSRNQGKFRQHLQLQLR
jgi:hypothetical protein